VGGRRGRGTPLLGTGHFHCWLKLRMVCWIVTVDQCEVRDTG
jgi:hypothetical protein